MSAKKVETTSKIVVIGDIHGRAVWKKIVNDNADADKFIFLGDYFDSHEKRYHTERQKFNFNEIISLQETLGEDKVILLLGNHDYHYISSREKYSGYDYFLAFDIKDRLTELYNSGKIKVLHIEDNLLFSHAGVTKTWLNKVAGVNELNDCNKPETFNHRTLEWNTIAGYDSYGDTKSNSPIWVRPASLISDKLDGYIQIVGHTTVDEKVLNDEHINKMKESDVYLADILPYYYIVIENSDINYVKIEYQENHES